MTLTLRRMIGLFVGYALAVIVASTLCTAALTVIGFFSRPSIGWNFFQTTIAGGMLITASTAWPGYLVTSWFLLSKRMVNRPAFIAMAGGLTAVQALFFLSFFGQTLVKFEIWIPAIMGGCAGAFVFSLCAEHLFNMRFKQQPSPQPSPSRS
ncbi:MAG: hypothetical protein WA921_10715 [Ahrensia sp.]